MITSGKQTHRFFGVGISRGRAGGPLRFEHSSFPQASSPSTLTDPKTERSRLQKAVTKTLEQTKTMQKKTAAEIGEKESQIFEIHEMLLLDEDFTDAMEEALQKGCSAEGAVETAARFYREILQSLDDPYLSARSADVGDIAQRLLQNLTEQDAIQKEQDADEPYILVARDLTPSQTVSLRKELILGFVTFEGTPNSHTSILARAMGIPALIGVGELDRALEGSFAILDAAEGVLTVSPDQETLAEFQKAQRLQTEMVREQDLYLKSLINKPAVTRSGKRLLIYANVGDTAEAEAARLGGADGIGLLRSELFYLSRDRYPTEEELLCAYNDIVERMEGRRVIIRTLDVGADKQIPYFDLPQEQNPALGFRAVRICLAREELFKTQLRAILRASATGVISVMIPMIVSLDEVRRCKRILEDCKNELRTAGIPFDPGIEFGIMIETPAAALMSDELAQEVDFFSVGTNDLIQYTLAADRQNPLVAHLGETDHEPVMRLIARAAQEIHATGGWIGICGELAADLNLTQHFLDLGVDELSVSPPYLTSLRGRVIECK